MLNRRQNSLSSSVIAGLVLVAFFLVIGTFVVFSLGSPPGVPSTISASPGPASSSNPTNAESTLFLPGLLLGAVVLVLLAVLVGLGIIRFLGRRRRPRYRQVGLLARRQVDSERRARETERRAREAALDNEFEYATAGGGRRHPRRHSPFAVRHPLLAQTLGIALSPLLLLAQGLGFILHVLGWPFRLLEKGIDRLTRPSERHLAQSSADHPLEPVIFEPAATTPVAPRVAGPEVEPVWRGPHLAGGAASGGFQRPIARQINPGFFRLPRLSFLHRRPRPVPTVGSTTRPAIITGSASSGAGRLGSWQPSTRPGFLGLRRRRSTPEIVAGVELDKALGRTTTRRLPGGVDSQPRPSPLRLLVAFFRRLGQRLRLGTVTLFRFAQTIGRRFLAWWARAIAPRLATLGAWLVAAPGRGAKTILIFLRACGRALRSAASLIRSAIGAAVRAILAAVTTLARFLAALPGRFARTALAFLRACAGTARAVAVSIRSAISAVAVILRRAYTRVRTTAAAAGSTARGAGIALGRAGVSMARAAVAAIRSGVSAGLLILRRAYVRGQAAALSARATIRAGILSLGHASASAWRFLAALPGRFAGALSLVAHVLVHDLERVGHAFAAFFTHLARSVRAALAGIARIFVETLRILAAWLRRSTYLLSIPLRRLGRGLFAFGRILRAVPRRTVAEIIVSMVFGAIFGLGALVFIYQNVTPPPAPTPAASEPASPTASFLPVSSPSSTVSSSPTGEPGDIYAVRRAALPACLDGDACGIYVVDSGDTLSRIATYFGITPRALAAANPQLVDPSQVSVGDAIRVPR